MGIYLNTMGYNIMVFLLKLFIFSYCKVFQVDSCVPAICPFVLFSKYFLIFWHSEMFQDHLIFSLPQCYNQTFSQRALIPSIREPLTTTDLFSVSLILPFPDCDLIRINNRLLFGWVFLHLAKCL